MTTHTYSYSERKDLSRALYSGNTVIIHAHGKVSDIKLEKLVVTKDDYLEIMKHNPGFRLIMNNIFVTTSVLFAGYGGSDPHFEDIINDLNMTLDWSNEALDLPRCYIMLRKEKATPIRKFIGDQHRVDIISFDDYSGMKLFLKDLSEAFPREK